MIGGGRSFQIPDAYDSAWEVSVGETAKVYAWTDDEKKVPLIWENSYGKGKFVVDNFGLCEKATRGFFAASYSLLTDVMVYPVLNGSVFYLDDFPSPVPSGDGTYIKRDYGLSIKEFYTNIWWPDMLDMAEEHGVKYTGVIIDNYEDDVSGDVVEQEDVQRFQYFGNMLLHQGGELGYHGYNHQPLSLSNVEADVYNYIEDFEMDPCGKPLGGIDTEKMERTLMSNGVLGSVECYKKVGGTVCVEVTQRVPIMRVMADDGNYYVDAEGQRMAVRTQYQAHLPLVTGRVDSVLTYRDMLPLARYIYNHRFWNAQIEQIYVNERHEVELVPRVGGQTILLGSVQDFETKLDNLMLVYKKVFSKAGWAMYDTVSLKFKNQVVCTRKKK